MLVLGKTNDDKGTQLEKLTCALLSAMGYTKIIVNGIRSGGEEIDVQADYEFQAVGGQQTLRLLCECKAHKEPNNMSAWLKFLGKIFSEEVRRQGQQISACFIALSGVNGNVSGHYEDIHSHRQNITLVTGERLLEQVSRIHGICDLETVNTILRRFTERQSRSVEIAYYDEQLFWIAIFEGDTYTLLRGNGELPQGNVVEALRPIVESVLAVTSYVDLREEDEANRRAIRAGKAVLHFLMTGNGKATLDNIIADSPDFTEQELRALKDEFLRRKWIMQSEDGVYLHLPNEDNANLYPLLIQIYRFLLAGEVTIPMINALTCQYHFDHINPELISHIQSIQGALPLLPDEIVQACSLLRWSPTALAWALQPAPMLVNHRTNDNLSNDDFKKDSDSFCRNYFMRNLFGHFRNDFRRAVLRPLFYQVHALREIETQEKIIIKSEKGVVLEAHSHERLGIGQLEEGYVGPDGNKWILLGGLDSSPEPWESRSKQVDTQLDSNDDKTAESTDA